jgi:probable phosphoglycerate mutase
MRAIVYVARHGETDWNREARWQGHTDIALNPAGRDQARQLAEALRSAGIVQVRSSDLWRARETAEIVALALGIPDVTIDAGLRERAFGCFEGLTREECAERFPEEWALYRGDIRLPPPGGEPHEQVMARMQVAVRRFVTALPAGAAGLVIGHGGATRALVTSLTGEVPAPMDNGATFRIEWEGDDFGAVTRIR